MDPLNNDNTAWRGVNWIYGKCVTIYKEKPYWAGYPCDKELSFVCEVNVHLLYPTGYMV